MTPRLSRVRVAGFRSLRQVELDLGPITVLIGPNGAGKSNLLAALTMARMLAFGSLELFTGLRGGASYLLHYGPRRTEAIELDLEFETETGGNSYHARLGYGANDRFVFLEERAGFRKQSTEPWSWYDLGSGHGESRVGAAADHHATPRTVGWLLRRLNFYHFHDTSSRSTLRTPAKSEDDRYLRSDGSNLAAYLLSLRDAEGGSGRAAWNRIQGLVRQVAPFVRELQPEVVRTGGVRLDWVDDQGETLGPSHLSDGTLRAIALFTALGQPTELLPILSCIDEPELGLHPAALTLFCGLMKSLSAERQILVSTQSPALLDELDAEDVVVAERKDGATELRRLDPKALEVWLDDYSLSELYDKNVLGGRP